MEIQILKYIEGAKKAQGLTVIIDVFRAFSLECYLYDRGVIGIRPIGSIEEAFLLKEKYPDSLLVGERQGKKVDGFDFGNTPSGIPADEASGKLILHTTSAGTQGIINATGASEIITGSLVNAKAIARYIKLKKPEKVSLVAMGNNGMTQALEDELCADYIKAMLEDRVLVDFEERLHNLRYKGGRHFFNPDNQEVFPEPDF